MKRLRTCVFPCAGYGTRFLPATKVIPKEMLPLVDKPVIQYGVEEALESGLGRIVIITSRGKDSILDHFDRSFELEASLRERDKKVLLAEVEEIAGLTHVISVRQKQQLGLGHAVLQAAPAVGDEAFAVVLPDDVILADPPCLHQMMKVYRETGRPVIALMEVPPSETHRYGIISGDKVSDRLFRLKDMVEKPKSKAPSNYAIIGRYILPPEIFEILENTGRGTGGEIQLTDGLLKLIESGDVYGYVFEGKRYDAGEKLGYLKATLDYALKHPELGEEFRAYLNDTIHSQS
ncbi:MAG: UTP--glucose-1-phosphate uridylyltransferase GalU [Thermoanaerobaculia bacterium]